MTSQWITFLLASLAIILAGIKLASFGEALGKHTGIGQGWVGLLFLATITSIPELTTTVTGASIGMPTIAVGNALGSNLFNVVILAVMDILLLGRGPFLRLVKPYHVASGGLAVLLTILVLLGMTVSPGTAIGGISPFSLLILATYLFGLFLLYRVEKRETQKEDRSRPTLSLGRALTGFMVTGGVIIAAGIFLVRASKAISMSTALSGSFMGAVLIAIVTSLPELSTSIGALRIGAYDMIVGDLFGSNMFNILTVFFADLAFRRGSIFAGLGNGASELALVGFLGIGLTTIAMVGIAYRTKRRVLGIGADALLILLGYLASTYLIIARGIHV
jgi:cation:H+ antiporter